LRICPLRAAHIFTIGLEDRNILHMDHRPHIRSMYEDMYAVYQS
jgi:hypothetical protein